MSAGGEAPPEREKAGDDTSWADMKLTDPKDEEIFIFKTYGSEIYLYSSHRVEHNDKNIILNRYHMSEINHFKDLLLCKMI
jgi:hypothetical protein